MPEVSVIIPNYNHAPYLQQRIESVLGQTYRDFELIILDDCSTDNSREIINNYKDEPNVSHIVFNETNSGTTFKQWKKGIELARGKYIWIAESDDWCEATLLDTLVTGLQQSPQCVLAYVQTYVVKDDEIQKVSTHPKLVECVPGKDYITQYLAEECTIWNASMLLFKKECYRKVSPDFTHFKMCGDWLFYIEMAKQGDVFISGKVLNYFRNHDKDVSGKMYSSGRNYAEELKILKILKNEQLISTEQFKVILLAKYIRFVVGRYRFEPHVQNEVDEAFFTNGAESYKGFLQFNAKVSLFKIRARRRLNMMLK